MAWMRYAQARRLSIEGKENSTELSYARGGADSTIHYDELVGTVSLAKFVPILYAQILVLQEQYSKALSIYTENDEAANQEGLGRLECCLLADKAWCRLHLGDKQGALEDANAALEEITTDTQIDDQAMTRSRVGHIFKALGEEYKGEQQLILANAQWAEVKVLQSRVVSLLQETLLKLKKNPA